MLAHLTRPALLAGLLAAALVAPAWSEDGDLVRAKTAGTERSMAIGTSSPEGPGVAEGTIATTASPRTTVEVGELQATGSDGTLMAGRRQEGTRTRVAYERPVRRPGLILGIAY